MASTKVRAGPAGMSGDRAVAKAERAEIMDGERELERERGRGVFSGEEESGMSSRPGAWPVLRWVAGVAHPGTENSKKGTCLLHAP